MLTGYDSAAAFNPQKTDWDPDDEREVGHGGRIQVKSSGRTSLGWEADGKVFGAFLTGALVSALYFKVVRSMT